MSGRGGPPARFDEVRTGDTSPDNPPCDVRARNGSPGSEKFENPGGGCRRRNWLVPGASGDVGLKQAAGGPGTRNESVPRPRGRSDVGRRRGAALLGGRGKGLALLDPLGRRGPPARVPGPQ